MSIFSGSVSLLPTPPATARSRRKPPATRPSYQAVAFFWATAIAPGAYSEMSPPDAELISSTGRSPVASRIVTEPLVVVALRLGRAVTTAHSDVLP